MLIYLWKLEIIGLFAFGLFRLVPPYSLSQNTIKSAEISRHFSSRTVIDQQSPWMLKGNQEKYCTASASMPSQISAQFYLKRTQLTQSFGETSSWHLNFICTCETPIHPSISLFYEHYQDNQEETLNPSTICQQKIPSQKIFRNN